MFHFIPSGYAPIRFHGNSKADLELDYSFFSDLELQKRMENPTITTTPGQERKKRAISNTTVQTLDITFRPVDVDSSVLLYSRTQTAIHILKVCTFEIHNTILFLCVYRVCMWVLFPCQLPCSS